MAREFLKEIWRLREDSHIKLLNDFALDVRMSAVFSDSLQLGRWIATCIVKTEKLDTRVQLIHKLIDTAQACLNMKNFIGVYGIMSGLYHPTVERLQQTFQVNKLMDS